eukprot:CAMPEP_0172327746 /NCGR_PEP_ID=MMETSP1058-20130122/59991_1 /TAXON_ID=83371 /ORGANISM="Detonula confervacea, Strain CCMP 353" /LENGTH=294 /DNA_ID=CAMNT_0013044829 /DNA_START=44 /DNA_END=928 /DNA_ORIENTATION=+
MTRLAPLRLLYICLMASVLLPCTSSLAIPLVHLHLSNSAALVRTPAQQRHHRAAPTRRTLHQFPRVARVPTSLRNDDLRGEIERAAQRRAYEKRTQGGGITGEAVGGAILGGLLGGPFGALFGAQIGGSFGASSQLDKSRNDEMKRKGISSEMLDQATEIGVALRQSVEGLSAVQESVSASQKLAKVLDGREKSIYERAKSAIESGDEEGARRLLLERTTVKEKLLKTLRSLAEERKRMAILESNVEALETRGLEIESLLRRSVGAAALQDSTSIGLSLEPEDPLLKKFRDLGM